MVKYTNEPLKIEHFLVGEHLFKNFRFLSHKNIEIPLGTFLTFYVDPEDGREPFRIDFRYSDDRDMNGYELIGYHNGVPLCSPPF